MTLELAEKIIGAGVKKAQEMNLAECLAVTDQGGNLVAFKRMDNASYLAVQIAIDKAYTAGFGWPTDALGQLAQPGQFAYGIANAASGRVMILAGGEPIVVDNELIGAVGVSGGKAPDDKAVAQAAAAATK